MAWFKVDDGLHDHRKTRKVRRSHPEKRRDVSPFGLWVLAGSWAGANGTSGFVPTEILEEWDDDAESLARRLVDAGLWWPTIVEGEKGYGFHDWDERNPVNEVDSGRYGNHLRWHVKRGVSNPDCEHCIGATRGDDGGDSGTTSHPISSPDPTRPDPTPKTCSSADAESEFEDWYRLYPRKVGRGAAVKAYRGARKKTDADTLAAAIQRQTPHLIARGLQFVPHPASWLNQERWLDELDGATRDPYPADGSKAEQDAWAERQPRAVGGWQ